MADDIGKQLVQAVSRLNAALFVGVFGDPESRQAVGRLFDGKLRDEPEQAEAVRGYLDRVAGKISGGPRQALRPR